MKHFEMTFTDHIKATRRAAELVESGVTAKYMGLWDGLYVVEYQANERLPEHTEPVTPEPAPVEMQYINRRERMPDGTRGDMALWPTFCPITSPGWVQIGQRPLSTDYHTPGDTLLVCLQQVSPADAKMRVVFKFRDVDSPVVITEAGGSFWDLQVINFSKGDHLTASEREAWHQEATGFQESYYSTFQK